MNIAATACSIPASAQTFVLSATVVPPGPLGFMTLWPQGQTQPGVSTLNALDAAVTSNLALVPTSNGSISVFPSNPTHLVMDIFGYFAPPPSSGPGVITVSSATVGQNLQAPLTITFSPPPTGPVTLTVTSLNPGLVLLGSPGAVGTGQLQTTITAGTESIATYAQALGGAGAVSITASAAGYTAGSGSVTLAPSGFVLSGPAGIGAAFSTFQGVQTTLTVFAAKLDSSGVLVQPQQVRGGLTVNVPISSSAPAIGTVSTSSVAFTGGVDNATVQFTASASNIGRRHCGSGSPSGAAIDRLFACCYGPD